MPRFITENVRGNLSDPKHRATALRREANRIGAKLDLLLSGHDAPVALHRGSFMFPQFRVGEDGQECDPKGRMDRFFTRLVKDTEFAGLTFYCLRHSFISLMLNKGIPAEQITTWVGHLDIKLTTTTYAAFLPDELSRLMESLHLFEAVS